MSAGPPGVGGDAPPPAGLPDDTGAVPRGAVPWLYAQSIVATLAGALFYLYLARVAPLDELGAAVVLQAFAMIAATAASLGLGRGFTHFLSYHRARGENDTARTLIRLSYLTAGLLSLAAAGVTVALSRELSELLFHSPAYTSTVELLALLSGVVTAGLVLGGVLLGLQRYVPFSTVSILGNTAMFASPIVLFAVWRTVTAIVIGWALGSALTDIALIVAIERTARRVGLSRVRTTVPLGATNRMLLVYSLPVVASVLITTSTYYVDRLVLASIANLDTVGVYNYAILFATAVLFLVNPFQAVLTPRISALFARSQWDRIRATVRNAGTLIELVFVPISLGTAALGPFLLRYIVGPAFVPAAVPLAVLLVIGGLFIRVNVLVALSSGTRRTSVLMASASSALVANATLSILLVPYIGMLGAALGNSAMFWAPFFVLSYSLRRSSLVATDVRAIAAIWVSSAIMALTIGGPLLFLHYTPIYVPLCVALGVGVFVVALRLLRALPTEATDTLVHHLPRWASAFRPIICWAAACSGCHHREDLRGPSPPTDLL